MGKFRVIYFIVISVTNNVHALTVAPAPGFGLSPTLLSVGFHVRDPYHSRQLRPPRSTGRYMGEDAGSSNTENDAVIRAGGDKTESNTKRKKEIFARAKMKKANSSSRPKLLTPPSILSSSRNGSDGRKWATNSVKGLRKKRSSPQPQIGSDADMKGKGKGNSTKLETPRKGSEDDSIKKSRNKKNGKIPPFSSASDVGEGNSTSPKSKKVSESWETLLDNPPKQPSLESTLFGSKLDLPGIPSSDPLLAGPEEFSSSAIEGVLPVSELFYRSTQSIISSDTDDSGSDDIFSSNMPKKRKKKKGNNKQKEDNDLSDDEELPFSAEQSDSLSSPGNKINIRRNKAKGSSLLLGDIVTGMSSGTSEVVQRELTTMAQQEQDEQRRLNLDNAQKPRKGTKSGNSTVPEDASRGITKPRSRKPKSKPRLDRRSGRKMVRRGMEMLVGGEPINADPPQRSVELNYYRKHPKLWARAITTNSPDFGPLLHMHSAGKVQRESIGLFCENFVAVEQKWGICSDDFLSVISENKMRDQSSDAASSALSVDEKDMEDMIQAITSSESTDDTGSLDGGVAGQAVAAPKGFGKQKQNKEMRDRSRGGRSGISSDRSLEPVHMVNDLKPTQDGPDTPTDDKLAFTLGGELKFSLGINRSELEYGNGSAFRRVLRDGIGLSINADKIGFEVHITKLVIIDVGGGSTDVDVQFQLHPLESMGVVGAERAAKEVNGALASAMDDGKLAMTLAHMAREEKGWSENLRSRIVEEFLFETEDDEENNLDRSDAEAEDGDLETERENDNAYDGPFGMEGDVIYAKDDIWLGGGNGGVFFDYSSSNKSNSPFKGKLGPLFLDASIERAKQNQPRVIAIGDVHGCIDELKALLKKCDYHPGDLVVFLGDLVCKGPDSLSVVKMAREIGAIGVRGNHDFEVVRWHQAIKSGADPPVIGSEHYYVASALNTADLKWMYSLPWFISSSQLNALFVHAGFVSGIRLAKQNPRLMMNMRSILPDGTVTSKFFNNWPWARLWDGPQTVFFGHDADRGLQQYEHAIGLDTGCVYGGKLTACILPERRIVSVNARREYFQYRRKHFD